MLTIKPRKGHLLIAEPSIIGDSSFNRSVILLADHGDEGTVGFILNKPLEFRLSDLVPNTDSSFKIYNGGPVQQENLYFIHKVPELIPESIEISLGIFWGGDFDVALELINAGKIQASDVRLFLGYSGWEPQQLEHELQNNSWVVTENIYKKSLIGENESAFWKEKMLELGDKYSIWSNAPENPNYN